MSDKTLVERLRDNGDYRTCRMSRALGTECNKDRFCSQCFDALANAIEREYLPRPRFEDGEPVQFGDMAEVREDLGGVIEMVYQDGKCVEVVIGFGDEETASHYTICEGERVKRPEPEALDADGVPIRVGDHIWHTPGVHYDGIEYVVTRVTKTRVSYRNAEGEFPRGNCLNEYASSNITHKQPDSLERIEEDATMPPREYVADRRHDVGLMDDEECTCWMCMDLLRRQREVLERGR